MESKLRQVEIKTFRTLIQEINPNYHSFDIKAVIWQKKPFWSRFEKYFKSQSEVTLTRHDLRNTDFDFEDFVLKTLLWGYPTVGRGTNIEKLLQPENLNKLTKVLENYKENDITLHQFKIDINNIDGLGISTMTKFAHFLNTKVDGYRALILDNRLMDIINSNRFAELQKLSDYKYSNALNKYVEYLQVMDNISADLGVDSEQLEMFLFLFGRNLSKPLGEEPFDTVNL